MISVPSGGLVPYSNPNQSVINMFGVPKYTVNSRVYFRCVCCVVAGWVLLLGPVALQWLRGLGKRSLWRCMSEIGFIGRILE
jgi:hypothetical protein